MEDFLDKLGIVGKFTVNSSGALVLDIEGADNYGRVFSKLDRSELVDEDEDNSQLTSDTSFITYNSDKYTITLQANFLTDDYKLVIKERI